MKENRHKETKTTKRESNKISDLVFMHKRNSSESSHRSDISISIFILRADSLRDRRKDVN
jgi:hypothetical protein